MERWTTEQLEASVDAYLDMWMLIRGGKKVVKLHVYHGLVARHGLNVKNWERRFSNLSHVMTQLGYEHVPGLKPLPHVGSNLTTVLADMIVSRLNVDGGSAIDQSSAIARRTAKPSAGLQKVPSIEASGTAESYRVARLCWNSDFWQKPTGRKGKSRNPISFEAQHGFGHEEWLFNRGTLIDGWKYGFIQALNHSHAKYEGQRLWLLLYSINSDTKQRFWAGKIDGIEVLTSRQAQRIAKEYRKRGWLKEMRANLDSFGLDSHPLGDAEGTELFNVRFRPESLRVFDPPVPFPVKSLPSSYYGTLQKVPGAEVGILGNKIEVEILTERNLAKLKALRHVYESSQEVDLVQSEWQRTLRNTLRIDLPGVESTIETAVEGHRIDVQLALGTKRVFVELKTCGTVRQVIRSALSQLMEYAYWPNATRCNALLIVGGFHPEEADLAYLTTLRRRFNLPVHYLPYKDGHIVGILDWWNQLPE